MENQIRILDHATIQQKLNRIAYQLHEYNHKEKDIVFVAIEKQGRLLAERLVPLLAKISDINIVVMGLKTNKKSPLETPSLDGDSGILANKSVVLIDDVLNSGRTLMYAAKFVLNEPVKKLATVVLVDRLHRFFPIKADFVGLTLSTTLQNHIEVDFKDGDNAAYLR